MARRPFGLGRLLAEALLLVVLAPLAVLGVLLGVLPVLLARATRLLPAAPAVHAWHLRQADPVAALRARRLDVLGATRRALLAGSAAHR